MGIDVYSLIEEKVSEKGGYSIQMNQHGGYAITITSPTGNVIKNRSIGPGASLYEARDWAEKTLAKIQVLHE